MVFYKHVWQTMLQDPLLCQYLFLGGLTTVHPPGLGCSSELTVQRSYGNEIILQGHWVVGDIL